MSDVCITCEIQGTGVEPKQRAHNQSRLNRLANR